MAGSHQVYPRSLGEQDLKLVVTGSSNHQASRSNHYLGCNTTIPEQFDRLAAVWGRR